MTAPEAAAVDGLLTQTAALLARRRSDRVKELTMKNLCRPDRCGSSIAAGSTGVEGRAKAARLEDRHFLEAVSRARLAELEGGIHHPGIILGLIFKLSGLQVVG
jgi:hypothetical protein